MVTACLPPGSGPDHTPFSQFVAPSEGDLETDLQQMAFNKVKTWFKGKASSTLQLTGDDVVVFVVGPTGSGKSSFVEQATKNGLIKIGDDLRPCTTHVQAVRCELTDDARSALGVKSQKNIVFVDTPSFHTQAEGVDKAEKEMSNWLSKSNSRTKLSTLAGTIYMHRVETNPDLEPIQKHLDAFANTFPEGFIFLPQRLHAVFSYEGRMSSARTELHKSSFQKNLSSLGSSRMKKGRLTWQTSFHPDLLRVDDSATAWQAVVELFTRLDKCSTG